MEALLLLLSLIDCDPRPLPSEALRFPDANTCAEARNFNHTYRSWLKSECLMRRWNNDLWDDLRYAEWAYEAWDLLDTIQRLSNNSTSWDGNRDRLGELKCLIGEAAFREGRMPAVAPWWRFREVR